MKKEIILQFYQSYKLYIFPVVVAFSSLFLIIFAIYPQTVKLIENQKKAGEWINKSGILAEKAAALEAYDSEDLSQKTTIALNALPAEKDYSNILGVLQGLAARSGFIISSISFSGSGGASGNASSYGVKMEVKGPGVLFKTFLSNLENNPRIIRVGSINISSNYAAEILSAGIAVEVLFSSVPADFGAVDSPITPLSQEDEQLLTMLSSSHSVPSASSSAVITTRRGKSNPFE